MLSVQENLEADAKKLRRWLDTGFVDEQKMEVVVMFYRMLLQSYSTPAGDVFLPIPILKKILFLAAENEPHFVLQMLKLSIRNIVKPDSKKYRLSHNLTLLCATLGVACVNNSCRTVELQDYNQYFKPRSIHLNPLQVSYNAPIFSNVIKPNADIITLHKSYCTLEEIKEFGENMGQQVKALKIRRFLSEFDPSEIAFECRCRNGPVVFPSAFMSSEPRRCKLILQNNPRSVSRGIVFPEFPSQENFLQNLPQELHAVTIKKKSNNRIVHYAILDVEGRLHSEMIYDAVNQQIQIEKFS